MKQFQGRISRIIPWEERMEDLITTTHNMLAESLHAREINLSPQRKVYRWSGQALGKLLEEYFPLVAQAGSHCFGNMVLLFSPEGYYGFSGANTEAKFARCSVQDLEHSISMEDWESVGKDRNRLLMEKLLPVIQELNDVAPEQRRLIYELEARWELIHVQQAQVVMPNPWSLRFRALACDMRNY